ERRQPVDRHHLRRRAAGPGQRRGRRRAETPYRRGQHGLAPGRARDGRVGRRCGGGPGPVRPARRRADGPGVRVYAYPKSPNFRLDEWFDGHAKWDPQIIRRPEGKRGWVRLPIRWTVERTFPWLGRCWRMSKVREKSVLSSESFIRLAMIHRLEPSGVDPKF